MVKSPMGMTRQEGFQAGFGMALAGFRRCITLAICRLRIDERNDPATLSHFRAAFLAVPDTTEEDWQRVSDEARLRYWRITNHYTGEQRDVTACTLGEAIAAAGWAVAEVEVNGPRSISHAEEDAAWAAYAAGADPDWAELEEQMQEAEDAQLDTTGLPFRR